MRRHCRVPDEIIVDQGPEFQSNDVEHAWPALGITKTERPATSPRFGAIVERLFGTTNSHLFHELDGTTRLLALSRQLSSTHHPSRHAVWTLPMLHEVCEEWLFQGYPSLCHSTLGDTPRNVFDRSRSRSAERVRRHVADDFGLCVLLALTPPRGPTRHVDGSRGIKIGYLRYWHELFEYGDVDGSDVRVKVDRSNCCVAYAFVRRRWRECRLAEQDADLQGRSWKQVALAVEELKARRAAGRRGQAINAVTVGTFLQEQDHTAELARQIARDEERLRILAPRPAPADAPHLRLVSNNTDSIECDAMDDVRTSWRTAERSVDDDVVIPEDFDDLEPFDAG